MREKSKSGLADQMLLDEQGDVDSPVVKKA